METTLDKHGETVVISEILNYEYIAMTSQWRATAYHCGKSFTTEIIQKRLRPHTLFTFCLFTNISLNPHLHCASPILSA